MSNSLFDRKIEFLKGVGPEKAAVLNKDLAIFTVGDLLQHYPFRYEDRTQFQTLSQVFSAEQNYQIKGKLRGVSVAGAARKQRMTAFFYDHTGEVELIWFSGVNWLQKTLKSGTEYILYGKPNIFQGRVSFPHPELNPNLDVTASGLAPVYQTSEKMKKKFLDSKALSKIMKTAVDLVKEKISDPFPSYLLNSYKFNYTF